MIRRLFFLLFLLQTVLFGPVHSQSSTPLVALSAVGSTASQPLSTLWSGYNRIASNQLSALALRPGGSVAGDQAVIQNAANIGATEAPLTLTQQVSADTTLLTVPIAYVPVVVAYNLPGVTQQLSFTPQLLADIFMREVTAWNDPQILAQNPFLNYTGNIVLVLRTSGSGTTYAFTDYLSQSAPNDWKLGKTPSPVWPLAGSSIPALDTGTVFKTLESTAGSIGYLAYSGTLAAVHSRQAALYNSLGQLVVPQFNSTMSNCNQIGTVPPSASGSWSDFSLVWSVPSNTWPLCTFTYYVVRQSQIAQGAQGAALESYMQLTQNPTFQAGLPALGYVPLSSTSVTSSSLSAINSMQLSSTAPPASAYQVVDISHGIPSNASSSSGSTGLTLLAAGSTFVAPFYTVVLPIFANRTADRLLVSYSAIGSSGGLADYLVTPPVVDFACSDAPLTTAQASQLAAAGRNTMQFPQTMGPVAVIHNIPPTEIAGPLNMTALVLSQIFQRQISSWADSSIRALNPNLQSSSEITVCVRQDGSGTTFAFSSFLTNATTSWTLGHATSLTWPLGVLAGQGSSGLVANVLNNPNSIGYVDMDAALTNHLPLASVQNLAGELVQPTSAGCTFAANVYTSETTLPGGENMTAWASVSIANPPGSGVYPICTLTYIMVDQFLQGTGVNGHAVVVFLTFLLSTQVQLAADENYYAALPASLLANNNRTISLIQTSAVDSLPTNILLPEPPGLTLPPLVIPTSMAPTNSSEKSDAARIACTVALLLLLGILLLLTTTVLY